ncbi:MAG: hypothetical protein JWM90_460 [Thermoleophilia bacterium]|nr:hypothetical protein [Thermoleophilia bacterium]
MTAITPVMGTLPQATAAQGSIYEIVSAGGLVGTPDATPGAFTMVASGTPGAIQGNPGVVTGQQTVGTAPQAQVSGGGAIDAVQGTQMTREQAIAALPGLIAQITALVNQYAAALQAGGAAPAAGAPAPTPEVTAGGPTAAAVGQCGMAGCTMDHSKLAA